MRDYVSEEQVEQLLEIAQQTKHELFPVLCFLTGAGLNLKNDFDVTWKDLHFADEGKEVLKRWNKKQK